jgi:hypothetical protein
MIQWSDRRIVWGLSAFLFTSSVEATTPPPKNENLLIADFEQGKAETLAGLSWVTFADEQLGGASSAQSTVAQPGAQGSQGALRVSFKLASGFQSPFTSVWALLGKEGLATDLSTYRGLRFYARSNAGTYMASVGQFIAGRSMRAMAPIEVKPDWTLVEVPFEKFARMPPPPAGANMPPVSKDVVSIGIQVMSPTPGQFDIEIDQVEVYK